MRVLVLGGTGAMGRHLVNLLADSGVETVVTSRQSKPSQGNVRYVQGDAHDEEFLEQLFTEQWDAVVDFLMYKTPVFQRRVQLLLGGTHQYIFLSTARVYAASSAPLTETDPRILDVSTDKNYLSTDEYALAKARQEDTIHASGKSNWTIIRPYITYSEIRLQLCDLEKEDWLYRAMHGRTIVLSADILSKVTTLTYGLDVAKGIQALIGNSQAFGNVFQITTSKSHVWADILAIYLDVLEKHLGYTPKVLLQDLPTVLRWKFPKYQILNDRLYHREFNNAKISQHVNTNTFSSLDIGLRKCVTTFLQEPSFRKISWIKEALRDRQAKEHTPLREITGILHKLLYISFRYIYHPFF